MMLGDLRYIEKLPLREVNKTNINDCALLIKHYNEDQDSYLSKFLKSDASIEQKEIVLQLAQQIADIWVHEKYENGKDPYAMQSRLAVLSHKLGLSTTFNCKSGKDRTGIMSAECNYLALAIDGTGEVPKPYKDLQEWQKLNLSRSLDTSGASKVTQACTGIQGLKIVRLFLKLFKFDDIANRFGEVRGGSAAATN